MTNAERKDTRAMNNGEAKPADIVQAVMCARCSKYEQFCENCRRYQPIDNYEGWCGSTKVSPRNWCSSWC